MGPVEADAGEASLATVATKDGLAASFDAHGDRLFRLALRLGANREDSRDLVQETFVRAASSAAFPTAPERAAAWLVRTLVNLRTDHWRRTRARPEVSASSGEIERAPDIRGGDPASRIAVRSAIMALPPRRRAVVVLHEIEGCSTSEIASLLGLARATVRWHLMQGRKHLAGRLLGGSS